MAVVNALRPVGIDTRVEPEDDPRHLAPVRAFLLGVEQPQIGGQMGLVIACQPFRLRWGLLEAVSGNRALLSSIRARNEEHGNPFLGE